MRGILYKLPFLASFLFMSLTFAQSNDYESGEVVARSKTKSRNMNNRDMMNNRQMDQQQDDSLCFEPRCGCDEDYKRCCYGLPLPVKCGWAFVEAEYLYWKAYTVVPYSAFKFNTPPFDFSGDQPYSSDIKTVSMSGDSGFRVTLGVYFTNCSYGSVQYRYFAADGSDSFGGSGAANGPQDADSFDNLWDIYAHLTAASLTGDAAFAVAAKQRHREKVLDFDYNKLFTCGRYTMTPYMGVRFAWVKSDLRIDQTRFNSIEQQPPEIDSKAHIDINKHMNLGVGLHTGFNTHADLCWGFGAYSTSSVSILIGQFQHQIREEMFDDPDERATITSSYKVTDFQTNYQLGVGLDWGKHFCKCCYYLGLKVGYEVNVWPNFFDAFAPLANGDERPAPFTSYFTKSLLTHGLNVGARFDF